MCWLLLLLLVILALGPITFLFFSRSSNEEDLRVLSGLLIRCPLLVHTTFVNVVQKLILFFFSLFERIEPSRRG